MSQPSHSNASFQLILQTTEQLIAEKGCRQTTLQDIINRSGLSKGAIYHYVSGKDELLALILKERTEEMNAEFFRITSDQEQSGLVNPLQMIATGVIQNSEHQNVTNKIFMYLLGQMENPKVAALVKDTYTFGLQTAQKWIEYGQQNNVIPKTVEAKKIAHMLITFMYGLRVQNALLIDDVELREEDVFQLMFHSLQGSKA